MPICSMGLEYFPTFTIIIYYDMINVGNYSSPMEPLRMEGEEGGEEGGSEGGVDTAGLLEVDAEDDRSERDGKGMAIS